MAAAWPWDALGWRSWETTSRRTAACWFPRRCDRIWARIGSRQEILDLMSLIFDCKNRCLLRRQEGTCNQVVKKSQITVTNQQVTSLPFALRCTPHYP